MNASATRFNKIKRDNNDDFHTVPIPFGEDGRLHPEYMNNHYGSHEHKRKRTAQRRTRTEDGKLINNHANNKAHPTLGVHLESAAFHFSKEFQDEAKRRGIDTRLGGARQNVTSPQQITGRAHDTRRMRLTQRRRRTQNSLRITNNCIHRQPRMVKYHPCPSCPFYRMHFSIHQRRVECRLSL